MAIVTRNLSKQLNFYQNILELELLFNNHNTVSLGKDKRLFLVLREYTTKILIT